MRLLSGVLGLLLLPALLAPVSVHAAESIKVSAFVNVRGAWASRFGLPSALVHNELLPVGSSDAGEGGLEL